MGLRRLGRAAGKTAWVVAAGVLVCCCAASCAAGANASQVGPVAKPGALDAGFRDPPRDAGIRCFWWWLNGNVTAGAITRDLEQMKAKGYSGALIFDADGSSQQHNRRVPAGPAFGSDQWTKLFVHACKEAHRLGLELSLNIQSGWNLGGPGVTEQQAAQRLVWTKAEIAWPGAIEQPLKSAARPGHFYKDVAVIAVPVDQATSNAQDAGVGKANCSIKASSTQRDFRASRAMDRNPDTFWVSDRAPTKENPQWLLLEMSKPVEISRLSLQGRKGYGPRECKIQLSLDGKAFDTAKEITLKDGEKAEANFAKRRVRFVRLMFSIAYDSGSAGGRARNVQVAEIRLADVKTSAGLAVRPIKDLALKSATRELGMSAPDCRFLLNTAPAEPGELVVRRDDIQDLTANMDANGTLHWNAPKGRWTVLRFGHCATGAHVSTQSAGWGGLVLDYMNPDSLRAYWRRNVEPLLDAIGPLAGTALRYVHTDSWEGGGMNWTPGFDRTFRENRGYDVLPWLAVLAGYVVDSREASNAFLADFRKTIGERVAGHYALLAKLAGAHGMGTHPECSGPHAGPLDGLENYGRSALIMSEFWSPSRHRPAPPSRFFVKQAASAAHTYGKRMVGAEGFTTIGPQWNDVPWAAMKPSFDHEFCAGLNLLFHHTFTCSPKSMGLPGQEYFAGTHFNPQVTWWDEVPTIIAYFNRCQYLAQRGRFVADVLYYYGDHVPNIARYKQDDPAGALPGYDYDVLSEELLVGSLTFKDGRLQLPSGMEYRVLVLPDHRVLSLAVLKKVDALVRAGATVLGPKPLHAVSLVGGPAGAAEFQKLADGLWGPGPQAEDAKGSRKVGAGKVAWGCPARELLAAEGVAPDVSLSLPAERKTPGMDWIHYRIGDADVYFLCELAGQAANVNATFRITGRAPDLWDAEDGSIRDARTFTVSAGRTTVPLQLDPYGSLFVVFRKPSSGERDGGPNWPTWRQVQSVAGPWDVTFDPNRGGPAKPVRFGKLTSWTDRDEPGIRYYSGKATYRTSFRVAGDVAGKDLAIELGDVLDVGIARVRLNGTDLGVTWRPPFRVGLAKAVKAGENRLEITVVNSWRNRLIGDQKLPEDKRLTHTNITVGGREWQLEKSGLMGPVRIVEKDAR